MSVQPKREPVDYLKEQFRQLEKVNSNLDEIESIEDSMNNTLNTQLILVNTNLDAIEALVTTVNGKLTNGSGTTALKIIDYAHHEIHAGSHFFYSDYDSDVDTASPKYYRITTPNTTKWSHMMLTLYSEGAGTWQLFENPTVSGAGTTATVYNNDRNSSTNATLVVAYDPTSGGDGTLLKTWRTGSGTNAPTRVGLSSRSEEELILKQNEDYFIKFTPDSDNTKTKIELEWYEHTNT